MGFSIDYTKIQNKLGQINQVLQHQSKEQKIPLRWCRCCLKINKFQKKKTCFDLFTTPHTENCKIKAELFHRNYKTIKLNIGNSVIQLGEYLRLLFSLKVHLYPGLQSLAASNRIYLKIHPSSYRLYLLPHPC